MMDNTYIFSSKQLKILLIGKGYKRVAGLNLSSSEMDHKHSLLVLNELVNNEILYVQDDKFFMIEDVKQIVDTLGTATSFDVLRTKKENLSDICCYHSHKLLISRNIQANREWYSFSFLSSEEFYEILLDDGYLPPDNIDEFFYDDELEDFEKAVFFDPLSIIDESSPVLLSLDIAVESNNHKYIRIMDYYFFRYIMISDGEEVERLAYSQNKFKEVFLSLMEN